MITEIGGTVGDIESLPFLEAIRQLQTELGRDRCIFVHLTLVPFIGHAGELKTKPTQHSVNELRRIGIQPDMVVCRSEEALSREIRQKIALFASLPVEAVISARDVDDIYKVPLMFRAEGVDDLILDHFKIEAPAPELGGLGGDGAARRRGARDGAHRAGRQVRAARGRLPVRGRGAASTPASTTARRSTSSGSTRSRSTTSESRAPARRGRRHPDPRRLRRARHRGQDQRRALRARALGSRSSASASACSSRWSTSPATWWAWTARTRPSSTPRRPIPVIDLLPEQKEVDDMGGTMRLGADPVKLHDGTRARAAYDEPVIYQRHRHRYEVNNLLRRRLEDAGLVFSGTSPGRPPGRGDRAAGAPVLRGLAVPPRVQVAAQPARAAVPRVRRRGARARARAGHRRAASEAAAGELRRRRPPTVAARAAHDPAQRGNW